MKIINQFFGLGDVIFSMSAIRTLDGPVMWPVMSEYVEGLNAAYPDVFFIDWKLLNIDYSRKDHYTVSGWEVIPLRWQDTPVSRCMALKYEYFGLPWTEWKDSAQFERDFDKELALLNLVNPTGEKFNLINYHFGCDISDNKIAAHSMAYPIPDDGNKNIVLRPIPGYSLFDWASVIQKAEKIYTISTSIIYLFELLELNAKEIHIHVRRPFERDHRNYDWLLSKDKPYILEP